SSTSSPVNFTITKATTANQLSVPANGVVQGSNVTLTANITSAAFAGVGGATFPSGTVTFSSGSTQLGSAPVFGQQVSQNGLVATASLNTSTLPLGQNTVTAQYGGDANYLSSSAAPVTVTVDGDFTFSAGSSSITVSKPGGSATNTLTITGQTGYNSTINFSNASCTGLPLYSKCAFSPASVGGSGSSTVTITTTAPSAALRLAPWTSTGIFFAGVLMLASTL